MSDPKLLLSSLIFALAASSASATGVVNLYEVNKNSSQWGQSRDYNVSEVNTYFTNNDKDGLLVKSNLTYNTAMVISTLALVCSARTDNASTMKTQQRLQRKPKKLKNLDTQTSLILVLLYG